MKNKTNPLAILQDDEWTFAVNDCFFEQEPKSEQNERFADIKFSEIVSMYKQQMRNAKTNDERRKQINNFRSGKF